MNALPIHPPQLRLHYALLSEDTINAVIILQLMLSFCLLFDLHNPTL